MGFFLYVQYITTDIHGTPLWLISVDIVPLFQQMRS